MSENLKKYVEDKIVKYTFWAKNFNKEDMDFVDSYCRKNYDNNRKVMILDLIRYKSENYPIILLDEKINFIYNDLLEKIDKLAPEKKEEEEKPKNKGWVGFGNKK